MSDRAGPLAAAPRSAGSAPLARHALRRRRVGGAFLGRRSSSPSSVSSASDAASSDSDDATPYPTRKPRMSASRRHAALASRRQRPRDAPATVAARVAVADSSASGSEDSPSSGPDSGDSPSSGADSDSDTDSGDGRSGDGQGAPQGTPYSAVPSLDPGTPGTAYPTRPLPGRASPRQRRRRIEPAAAYPDDDLSSASPDSCPDSDVDEAAACRRKHGRISPAALPAGRGGKRAAIEDLPASIPAPETASGDDTTADDDDGEADDEDEDEGLPAPVAAPGPAGAGAGLPSSIPAQPATNTTAGGGPAPSSSLLVAPPAATVHMPVPVSLPPMGQVFQQPVENGGDGARIEATNAGLAMAAPGLATLATYAVLARWLMGFFA